MDHHYNHHQLLQQQEKHRFHSQNLQQHVQQQQHQQQQVVTPAVMINEENSTLLHTSYSSAPVQLQLAGENTSSNSAITSSTDPVEITAKNSMDEITSSTPFVFGNQTLHSPQCTTNPITAPTTAVVTIDSKLATKTQMNASAKKSNTANSSSISISVRRRRRISPSIFNHHSNQSSNQYQSSQSHSPLSFMNKNTNGSCTLTPTPATELPEEASCTAAKPKALPYVTVEGRRKRRRTNLNDAFRYLSIMEQNQNKPFSSNSGSMLNTHGNHHMSEKLNSNNSAVSTTKAYSLSQEALGQTQYTHANSSNNNGNHNESYSSLSDVNKSMQSYDEMDGLVMHSKLDYNHETSFCSFTSTVDEDDNDDNDNDDVNVDISIDADGETNMSDDNDYDSENTINNLNNNSNNDNPSSSSSALPPIHSILFAPRKDRNKQRTMIYDQFINPVDDRIEELIRHSRIQAMVHCQSQSNTIDSKEKENTDNSSGIGTALTNETRRKNDQNGNHWNLRRRRNYENMLFDSYIPSNNNNNNNGRMKNHSHITTHRRTSTLPSNNKSKLKYNTKSSCDDNEIQWEQQMNRKVNHKKKESINSLETTVSNAKNHPRSRSAPRAMKYMGQDEMNDIEMS